MASGGGETINLDTLSVQQLSQVKKQLDEEIEHLTSSFTQLHAAQAKFRECLRCVGAPKQGASSALQNDKSVLVPLTNSLYVRGTLTNADHVLVDVGTGFYIEKSIESAAQFYESKVGQVGASLKELEAIVQGKTSNVRLIEDVLRQKMASQPQQAAAQS